MMKLINWENSPLIIAGMIIILAIVLALGLAWFKVGAYTIVDTVYVEDSITVTMSMEEWEEYLELLDWVEVIDALKAVRDADERRPAGGIVCSLYEALDTLKIDTTNRGYGIYPTYFYIEHYVKPNESDLNKLFYIGLDKPIPTPCIDTTNPDNLYEEL